jgi:hypothetical protein
MDSKKAPHGGTLTADQRIAAGQYKYGRWMSNDEALPINSRGAIDSFRLRTDSPGAAIFNSIQFNDGVCVRNSDGVQVDFVGQHITLSLSSDIIPLKMGITGTGCRGRATRSREGPKNSADSAEERPYDTEMPGARKKRNDFSSNPRKLHPIRVNVPSLELLLCYK